jgi:hypothetical protein
VVIVVNLSEKLYLNTTGQKKKAIIIIVQKDAVMKTESQKLENAKTVKKNLNQTKKPKYSVHKAVARNIIINTENIQKKRRIRLA